MPAPLKVTHGNGTGAPCAGCGVPVQNTQIQVRVEFDGDRRLLLHTTCFGIWQKERSAR